MSKHRANANYEVISAAAARWVARRETGLSEAERAEFECWLAADSRHRRAVEHFSTAWAVFDRPYRAGTADAVVREVGMRVRRRRRGRLQFAGTTLALLFMLTAIWQWPQPAESEAPSLRAGAVVLRPERCDLPDGSVVDLKAGAEITVAFEPRVRRVTLHRGEAHFQVAKNAERPFVVEVGGVEVRAVGTAFLVQVGSGGVEVLVTEGRVAVERPDGPAATVSVPQVLALLGVGDRTVVDVAASPAPSPVQAVASDEMARRLAWRSPRLEFSGTPLAEAVALMNQSTPSANGTNKILLVVDPSSSRLAQEPVSGLFRADNAETFARVLEVSLGVQVERRENKIILRKAKE